MITTPIIDPGLAVEALEAAMGAELGPARFPGSDDPLTPDAFMWYQAASVISTNPSGLGDLLSWATANPVKARELAEQLGGREFESSEAAVSSKILFLRDGNAVLWATVQGIYTRGVNLQVNGHSDDWYITCDSDEETRAYRDELIAQWQKAIS